MLILTLGATCLTRPSLAGRADVEPLVDLATVAPGIAIEMRYATRKNFTKTVLYPRARCLLRRSVAARLARVHAALSRRKRGLKVWDCYRPVSVQQTLWKLVPDARYVARPIYRRGVVVDGSKHNRGAAVDLTLVDHRGAELPMPTAFDDFTERAHRSYRGGSRAAQRNKRVLERAMRAQGFVPLTSEWWHFDAPGWRRFPVSNQSL